MELTVDFPAPGGPAMTSKVDMLPCVSASHGVINAISETLTSPSGGQAPTPSVDHVVDVLLRIDRLDDHAAARRALRPFAARPRPVVWLDERIRRILWMTEPAAAAIGLTVKQLAKGTASPAGLVLASMHRDGRVREQADAGMLAAPDPVWLPFLVLRAADWVVPVRDRARGGLAVFWATSQQPTYRPCCR